MDKILRKGFRAGILRDAAAEQSHQTSTVTPAAASGKQLKIWCVCGTEVFSEF